MTWETIANIHRLTLVRSLTVWFAIIPLLVRVVHAEGVPQIIKTIELPFTWGIFYAASLAFFLSTLVYMIFCPRIIRKYASWKAFAEAEGSFEKLVPLALEVLVLVPGYVRTKFIEKLIVSRWVRFYDSNRVTEVVSSEDAQSMAQMISIKLWNSEAESADAIASIFATIREMGESSRSSIRYVITILHFIGFALIMAVLVENVNFVIEYYAPKLQALAHL